MKYSIVPVLVACTAICFSSVSAQAGTVSYSASVPLNATNWNNSIGVQLFDSSLGILDSVTFLLTGYAEGTGKFESQDTSPSTVLMKLQATLKLRRPDSSLIVETIPVFETSDAVTAYDGVLDFAGTSGKTYSNVNATKADSATLTSVADLTLFTGTGTLPLPILAEGSSWTSGAGNITTSFSTFASADVKVTYTYHQVPEPSTMVLLGLAGVFGLLVIRRRK